MTICKSQDYQFLPPYMISVKQIAVFKLAGTLERHRSVTSEKPGLPSAILKFCREWLKFCLCAKPIDGLASVRSQWRSHITEPR